jgi:hypothetical protein
LAIHPALSKAARPFASPRKLFRRCLEGGDAPSYAVAPHGTSSISAFTLHFYCISAAIVSVLGVRKRRHVSEILDVMSSQIHFVVQMGAFSLRTISQGEVSITGRKPLVPEDAG